MLPTDDRCALCFAVSFLPPDATSDQVATAQNRRHRHFLGFPTSDALRAHLQGQYATYAPEQAGHIQSTIEWYRTTHMLKRREREVDADADRVPSVH